jgi:hypothetical protein
VPSRFVIATVALVGVSACGLISNIVFFQMVAKVNERLPKERQFAPLWWYWPKYQRLKAEYKKLYPGGNLLRRVRVLGVLMFACLLICAWAVGFFAR